MIDKNILMPVSLTAEGGHKSLLIGEFFETIEVQNPDYCGCGKCDFCIDVQDEEAEPYMLQKVPISWSKIKEIYAKVVEFEKSKNK